MQENMKIKIIDEIINRVFHMPLSVRDRSSGQKHVRAI